MYLFKVLYKQAVYDVIATRLRESVLWYRLRKELDCKTTQTVYVKAEECIILDGDGEAA